MNPSEREKRTIRKRPYQDLSDLPEDMRPTFYPGVRPCLKCGDDFESECRRRNQICGPCRVTNEGVVPDGGIANGFRTRGRIGVD